IVVELLAAAGIPKRANLAATDATPALGGWTADDHVEMLRIPGRRKLADKILRPKRSEIAHQGFRAQMAEICLKRLHGGRVVIDRDRGRETGPVKSLAESSGTCEEV